MFEPTTCDGEFQFFDLRVKATGKLIRAERMPNGIYHQFGKSKRFGLPAVVATFRPEEVELVDNSER
jgi:hypothetical protein